MFKKILLALTFLSLTGLASCPLLAKSPEKVLKNLIPAMMEAKSAHVQLESRSGGADLFNINPLTVLIDGDLKLNPEADKIEANLDFSASRENVGLSTNLQGNLIAVENNLYARLDKFQAPQFLNLDISDKFGRYLKI